MLIGYITLRRTYPTLHGCNSSYCRYNKSFHESCHGSFRSG